MFLPKDNVMVTGEDARKAFTITNGLTDSNSIEALMLDLDDNSTRVLRKQWQGEFCRCSIDVVGGKQCDGCVDHLKRFRHNAGPSPKAGKPVAQPAVDPLNRHRFILPDIVPPNRQERVVRI